MMVASMTVSSYRFCVDVEHCFVAEVVAERVLTSLNGGPTNKLSGNLRTQTDHTPNNDHP